MLTLSDFQCDLFSGYIEKNIAPVKETSLNFDKDGDLQEITEYRNNSLFNHFIVLHKAYPINKKKAWAAAKAYATMYCPSLVKEPGGWKEIKTTFKSAGKTRIAKEARKENGIVEDLILLNSADILKYKAQAVRWIVPGVIPKAGIVAICSDAGIGKTWLALHMCISVATGKKFLNKYEVEKGSVIYVNQEMAQSEFQARLKNLGLTEDAIFYTFLRRGFSMEEYGEDLISLIKEIEPTVVIFDSLIRIHAQNENSSQEMEWVFKHFIEMSDLGSAVLILHHVTKGENQSYRGSTAIKSGVDLMLTLSRDKNKISNYKINYDKIRIDEEPKPLHFQMLNENNQVSFEYIEQEENNDSKSKGHNKQKRTSTEEARSFIMRVLTNYSEEGLKNVPKEKILECAERDELSTRKIEDELQDMVNENLINSPKKGIYSLIQNDLASSI